MFSRATVIVVLITLVLSPGAAVRARNVSDVRVPPPGIYSQALSESEPVRLQERLALHPLVDRRPVMAERPLIDTSAASGAIGRRESVVRSGSPTAGYEIAHDPSAVPVLTSTTAVTCTVTARANSGPGSLRQCLLQASANGTILFDPVIFPPAAPATITLASGLPIITADNLMIDGSNAGVVLDGSGVSRGEGLVISIAGGVTVRGLQILNFPGAGLALTAGAHDCIIGGDRAAGAAPLGQGNVISRSRSVGVMLRDAGTTHNRIIGNHIGTDVMGTRAWGNSGLGIFIDRGANGNVVGGETSSERNLISDNGQAGVWIQGQATIGNRVSSNYIGTDITGGTPWAIMSTGS